MTRRRYIICIALAALCAILLIAQWAAWGFSYHYAAYYGWAQLKQDSNSSEVRTWRASFGRGTLALEVDYYRRTLIVPVVEGSDQANSALRSAYQASAAAQFATLQNLDADRAKDGNGWHIRPIPRLRRPIQSQPRPIFERGQIPGSYSINLRFPMWAISLFLALACLLFWRLRGIRHKAGHCRHCGYSLVGNCSGACPECGTACAVTKM